MAGAELIDAREAMDLLNINENELQTLVARGTLRAFRSAGTMKFRREDVLGIKTEKQTDPTIIIPAAGGKKPGASGILSAVKAGPAGSGFHAGQTPADANQTGNIVFDDIVLMSPDDGMATQQGTVVQSAVQPVNQTGSHTAARTHVGGDATIVDEEVQVTTGTAKPVGGRTSDRQAPVAQSRIASPAISQGRAAVAQARRVASVYEVKTQHPIMTAVLIINACIFLFTASIFTVYAFKGHYDADSGNRIIPPFLSKDSFFTVYKSNYYKSWFTNLPGTPQDKRPDSEEGPPPMREGDQPSEAPSKAPAKETAPAKAPADTKAPAEPAKTPAEDKKP